MDSDHIAKSFLRASVRGGARPGDPVGPGAFQGFVAMPLLSDWKPALKRAVSHGWLAPSSDKQLRLTVAGYAAAAADDAGTPL
jgi:hypothetical protein